MRTSFFLFYLSVFTLNSAYGQDFECLMAEYSDSTNFKIVFRTEEDNGDRMVALDNLTILVNGDTTDLYYLRYGDGMVSQLMIPWSIMEELIELENQFISKACAEEKCDYSIRIEVNGRSERIPIDVLQSDMLAEFMLNQE